MNIRFANENDKAGIYKTMGYCFNTPYNSIKNNIENGSFAKNEKFVVAVDDNNDIKSLFAIIDYNTYFEGKIAKMAGIAGVSSLPENRGEGNIEDLFKFALKYMNDNDFIFSALGPFAFQYYRKFGYEWCYTWQLVSIPIEDLKNFKSAFTYEHIYEDKFAIFNSFRNEIIKNINGAIIRDEELLNDKWQQYVNSTSHVYVAKNENNEIVSAMVYHQENREIKVSEMYFKDEISRQYLLAFLYRHRSNTDSVELILANDDEIRNILPSPRIKYWNWPNKMGRVVNVKKALELLRIEDEFNGSFTINVEDKHALWNNKTFKITCLNNKLVVEEVEEKADFDISIQRITQLIYGHIDAKEAIKLNLIKVNNENKTNLLKKVFVKRTTMLWQEF